MSTTEKRITLALTKEDLRVLSVLQNQFGETTTQVFKRALILLDVFSKEDKIIKKPKQ